MNQAELLRYVVDALESLGIDYMITGSQASIYYGEARQTLDIDIVADIRIEHLPEVVRRFPETKFYLSQDAAAEAIAGRRQFNIIDADSGFKIDLVVRKDTEFHRTEFDRRRRYPLVEGREAYFARAEDIILSKLLFVKQGASERHLRDIAGILRTSGREIDRSYIEMWAERLTVRELWSRVGASGV